MFKLFQSLKEFIVGKPLNVSVTQLSASHNEVKIGKIFLQTPRTIGTIQAQTASRAYNKLEILYSGYGSLYILVLASNSSFYEEATQELSYRTEIGNETVSQEQIDPNTGLYTFKDMLEGTHSFAAFNYISGAVVDDRAAFVMFDFKPIQTETVPGDTPHDDTFDPLRLLREIVGSVSIHGIDRPMQTKNYPSNSTGL